MENNAEQVQTTYPTDQSSTVQSYTSIPRHSKKLFLLLFIFISIILIVLSGCVGFLLARNQYTKILKEKNTKDMLDKAAQVSPTSIPQSDTVNEWKTYIVPNTTLQFRLPQEIIPTITANSLKIPLNQDLLVIEYTTDGSQPKGYSGTPAGDWGKNETVYFLGNKTNKTLLKYPPVGVTFVVYGREQLLKFQNYQFIITLNWESKNETGISQETIQLADQILAAFSLDNQVISKSFLNQFISDTPQFTWSKPIQKNNEYYFPNAAKIQSISGQEINATLPDNFDISDFYKIEQMLQEKYNWEVDNNNSAGGSTGTIDSFIKTENNTQQALLFKIFRNEKLISLFLSDPF